MLKITRLINEAKECCLFRGHKMSEFSHEKQKYMTYTKRTATSHCIVCDMEVVCIDRPASNEIDIGGEAVALSCKMTCS